jgi:hypothetical protein
MLKWPNYNKDEYNCVDKNLYIVDFIIELEEVEKQLKTWEAAKARLNAEYGTEGHSLMVFLQNRIAEYRDKIPEETRKKSLKDQVERFRNCMRLPNNYANNVVIQKVVGQICYLYGNFDIQLFEKELNEILEDEIKKSGDIDKQFAQVNGHIGQWRRKHNELWRNVGECFVDGKLPKYFKSRTQTPHCSEIEIAESVIRTFAKDWRERCTKFDRPVTITGIDISTLPREMKKNWLDAYKKFGLDDKKKYPKFPIFCAIESKDKEPQFVENKSLPGKFAGVGVFEGEE